MKECKYCGTQCEDHLDKCPSCGGSKFYSAQEQAFELERQQKEIDNQVNSTTTPGISKRRLLGILGGIVAVIAIIIAIASYALNRPLSNGMTKDESKKLFSTGTTYLESGDYKAAIECFLQLSPDSQEYSEAQSLLEQSKASYRGEIIDRVNSHLANKKYDVAFDLIRTAKELLSDDPELESTYNDVYSAYRSSVLEQVNSYTLNGQYELALEYLTAVKAEYPNDAALQDSYSSTLSAYQAVIRTDAIEQADAYVSDGDYENAIKVTEAAFNKIRGDSELQAKLTVYKSDYVSYVISKAKDQYTEYDADSLYTAEDLINDALKTVPDSQQLIDELNYYIEHEPISIFSFEPIYDVVNDYFHPTEASDAYGNDYTDALLFWVGSTNTVRGKWADVCIKNEYRYSRITGVVFYSKEYPSAPINTQFVIGAFLDGNSYWTDPFEGLTKELWRGSVSNDTKPYSFSVDISQVQNIKLICMGDTDVSNGAYPYAYIAKLYLWK